MTDITFSSKMPVTLIDSMGSDASVVNAARVSYTGEAGPDDAANDGLIRFMMRNRHGSPFEHNSYTFFVKAPIFVFREFHRHRINSYNEQSGRYSVLDPEFYYPSADRPGLLVEENSKAGEYSYVNGEPKAQELVEQSIRSVCTHAYEAYTYMLSQGIAKEVARMVLPVTIYSSMYVTMNARAIMAFLSLRKRLTQAVPVAKLVPRDTWSERNTLEVEWEGEAMFASKPQWEIEQVANQIEALWKEKMPVTHAAFVASRYVAP